MKERVFTVLAVLFLLGWIWTEIEERQNRQRFEARMEQFMEARGPAGANRFTAQEGDELRERVEELEEVLGEKLRKD